MVAAHWAQHPPWGRGVEEKRGGMSEVIKISIDLFERRISGAISKWHHSGFDDSARKACRRRVRMPSDSFVLAVGTGSRATAAIETARR
jgi:hypothetical protein